MWLWVVAILVSLPIAGYIADLVVDGVDSVGSALAGGLIVGTIIGGAEWFVLRQRVSWLWVPATTAGMAVGADIGARTRSDPWSGVVGCRESTCLGTWLDRDLVRDLAEHR